MSERPLDNAQKIERLLDHLWHREKLYEEKRMALADAEHAYRIKLAVEFGVAVGSAEARKHEALVAASEHLKNREVAAAASDIAYQKLQDVRAALIARQTLAKNDRERPV